MICANRGNLNNSLYLKTNEVIIIIFKDKNKFKNKFGIYGIKNIINNNVYVGKTSTCFKNRYYSHRQSLNKNKHCNGHLQNAWNKYGEDNFIFFVIDVVSNKLYLDYLEKYYIKYYRCKHHCYNISDGGEGGCGCKVPDISKYIYKENISNNMKQKINKTRSGIYIKRITDVINEEIAKEIKIRLMNNETPKHISIDLDVSYKIVNAILSNNTWSHVKVDGWDEWRTSRKTYTRLSKKDHEKIYKLYKSNKYTKYELAELYGKGVKMIEKILRDQRELHGNPVPSQ